MKTNHPFHSTRSNWVTTRLKKIRVTAGLLAIATITTVMVSKVEAGKPGVSIPLIITMDDSAGMAIRSDGLGDYVDGTPTLPRNRKPNAPLFAQIIGNVGGVIRIALGGGSLENNYQTRAMEVDLSGVDFSSVPIAKRPLFTNPRGALRGVDLMSESSATATPLHDTPIMDMDVGQSLPVQFYIRFGNDNPQYPMFVLNYGRSTSNTDYGDETRATVTRIAQNAWIWEGTRCAIKTSYSYAEVPLIWEATVPFRFIATLK